MKYINFSDLTKDERSLLEQHYEFYKALDHGTRKPATVAQRHFVEVCRMQADPNTKHERVYLNYLKLMKKYNERYLPSRLKRPNGNIESKKNISKSEYAERNKRDKEELEKQKLLTKTQQKHKEKTLILNKQRLKEERKAISKLIISKKNVRDALIVPPD